MKFDYSNDKKIMRLYGSDSKLYFLFGKIFYADK